VSAAERNEERQLVISLDLISLIPLAGEMLMPQGRCLGFMDAVSNGLDASTTYDIMAAFKVAVKMLKITNVTSLLQVLDLSLSLSRLQTLFNSRPLAFTRSL
jgi:hypothetical protein